MSDYRIIHDDELMHYGVPGMRWGHRKNVYDINANYYNKRADKLTKAANRNRTMAGMNAHAANQGNGVISKVNRINANYYNKRADKLITALTNLLINLLFFYFFFIDVKCFFLIIF